MDIKLGSCVNVAIAFENDYKINKSGIFYLENIVISEIHQYDSSVFILKFFLPFQNKEYKINFRKNKLEKLDYASLYGFYFIVNQNKQSKKYNMNRFFEQICLEHEDIINDLKKKYEKEVSKLKESKKVMIEYILEKSG